MQSYYLEPPNYFDKKPYDYIILMLSDNCMFQVSNITKWLSSIHFSLAACENYFH